MIIRRIHIDSFGPLRDLDFKLYSGMNFIRGDNESGKTSLAMFIKFIFYGLSGRSTDGTPSERKKYVNWDTGKAGGYIEVECGEKAYRIERCLTVSRSAASERESARDNVTVTDMETGGRISDFEECPGAALFGVPEQVFVNTVFAGQSGRGAINGADTAAAVENLLFSADETVSVKKAADILDKYRRTLMHKKGSGGEISALREKHSDLKQRLDDASAAADRIIELENTLSACQRLETQTNEFVEVKTELLRHRDAEEICKEGRRAAMASKTAEDAEAKYRSALSFCCDPAKLDEGVRLSAAIASERAGIAEFEKRLTELETGAASASSPDAPESPEDLLVEYGNLDSSASGMGVAAAVLSVIAGIGAVGAAVLFALKSQAAFLGTLGVVAALAIIAGVLFVVRAGRRRRMKEILSLFGVSDGDELEAEVSFILSKRRESEDMMVRADSVRMSLGDAMLRAEALETEAGAIAASFESCTVPGPEYTPSDDPSERLKAAVKLALSRQSEADALKIKAEAARADAAAKWSVIQKDKLSAAEEYLRGNPDREGVPASEAEADEMQREVLFYQARLKSLLEKKHNAEVEIAARRASAEDPTKLWEELWDCENSLKEKLAGHDAVELAISTLAEAGENMRHGIIPRIVRRASGYFSASTGGRYESLGAGSAFELSAVADGGYTRDIALLSSGTEDLAYVCLRVALASELFGGKKPPLVFDESLAFMDPGRSGAAADVLAASGHQVLYFTCRPEDAPDPTLVLSRR